MHFIPVQNLLLFLANEEMAPNDSKGQMIHFYEFDIQISLD